MSQTPKASAVPRVGRSTVATDSNAMSQPNQESRGADRIGDVAESGRRYPNETDPRRRGERKRFASRCRRNSTHLRTFEPSAEMAQSPDIVKMPPASFDRASAQPTTRSRAIFSSGPDDVKPTMIDKNNGVRPWSVERQSSASLCGKISPYAEAKLSYSLFHRVSSEQPEQSPCLYSSPFERTSFVFISFHRNTGSRGSFLV